MSDPAIAPTHPSPRPRRIVLAALAAALVLAVSSPARAQLADTLKFQTPFPFMVGRTAMPAGTYTITPLPGDNSLLRLSNGQSSVLVFTENDAPRRPPKIDEVTFTRKGDTYVLREIWDASTESGVEPVVSAHAGDQHRHAKGK
jgi:hypothetical protein